MKIGDMAKKQKWEQEPKYSNEIKLEKYLKELAAEPSDEEIEKLAEAELSVLLNGTEEEIESQVEWEKKQWENMMRGFFSQKKKRARELLEIYCRFWSVN